MPDTNQVADNKTVPTDIPPEEFIAGIEDARRRADAEELLEIMRARTGASPMMWGPSIIGFGRYHYRYASGREGDFMPIGFSPRKSAISLYIYGDNGARAEILARLGTHKRGSSCLYVTRLSNIDTEVLGELIDDGLRRCAADWP